jgi:hypothetical protein
MSQGLPLPQNLQNNSLPINTLADGNNPNDILTWDGTEWISAPSSGGGGIVLGTSNQITANTVGSTTTLSLPNTLITPGSLSTTTSITDNSNLIVEQKTTLGSSTALNSNLSINTLIYNTGTASQSGSTITGVGTNFTSALLGLNLVFANGTNAGFIVNVLSTTSMTVSTSQIVGVQSYSVYSYSLSNSSSNVSIDTLAAPSLFAAMPINNTLTFPGTVSQSANIITGSGTNFTSALLGMHIVYTTGVYGGLITAVSSTTSLTVNTSQTIASTNYIIQYPGFQVNSTGQSVVSGKALTTETITTSTTLNSYIDSIIDTTNGSLTCNLGTGIANQYKVVKLSTIKSSPATISCVLGGGGTFQLTPTDYIRELRYDANVGYWQIEAGVSQTTPVPSSFYPTTQQGTKLVGTGNTGLSNRGYSTAVSADGNILALGGYGDNSFVGAVWIFTRSGTTWTQQGTKLVGTGNTGSSSQGYSCALSADGNTLAVGGSDDNSQIGATWIFIRSGTVWTQQGTKLVGTGNIGSAYQGSSCALSADGNTLAVGGWNDDTSNGAAWIFTRSGTAWTQQAKLVGTGYLSQAFQGISITISSDGNTVGSGGSGDNFGIGAAWIFTRSGTVWTQQTKLVGTGVTNLSGQGMSCSLSADGNTFALGGGDDNTYIGATWIFTRTRTTWTQQGTKLVGTGSTGGASYQGWSSALSGDGNTLVTAGYQDNINQGAAWIFTRSGSTWSQRVNKLVGTGNTGAAQQAFACSISANGNTLVAGAPNDNSGRGAVWVFI